jgi:Tetratricopeptide repeat
MKCKGGKYMKQTLLGSIILIFVVGFSFAQQPQSQQMQAVTQLVRTQKWTEAIAALDEIVKNEPQNARAWFLLGQLNHQLGNYEKAAQAYEKNIPISNNPSAMYNLACAYSRLKQNDKAFEWLEKTIIVGNGGGLTPETDDDLENLRSDTRFQKTLELFSRKSKPCLYQPESRQFDFWIGEWDVYPSQAPSGQAPKIGENKVERISEGCGLLENWKSPSDNGKSINYYDRSTAKWYQYWIGSRGESLRYEGSFQENSMSFTGDSMGKDGKKILNRLTFFKINENTVRQFAEVSTDEGKTWTVSYDFRYEKRADKTADRK